MVAVAAGVESDEAWVMGWPEIGAVGVGAAAAVAVEVVVVAALATATATAIVAGSVEGHDPGGQSARLGQHVRRDHHACFGRLGLQLVG